MTEERKINMTFDSNCTGQQGQTCDGWIHTDSSVRPATPHSIRADLKAEGRHALLGHLGLAVGSIILFLVLYTLLHFITGSALPAESGITGTVLSCIFSLFISAFSGIYEYGLICIYIKLLFRQPAGIRDFFLGFRENQDKILILSLVPALLQTVALLPAVICSYLVESDALLALYVVLLLLGVAVSIYGRLLFYPSLYLLLDYPDRTATEILRRSIRLMKGHKKELLFLELSFLPLLLLTLLSFGAAGLWVAAYRRSTLTAYYRRLMGASGASA